VVRRRTEERRIEVVPETARPSGQVRISACDIDHVWFIVACAGDIVAHREGVAALKRSQSAYCPSSQQGLGNRWQGAGGRKVVPPARHEAMGVRKRRLAAGNPSIPIPTRWDLRKATHITERHAKAAGDAVILYSL